MPPGTSPSVFFGGPANDALVFGAGQEPFGDGTQTGFFFLELPTGIYFDNILLEDAEQFWEDRSPITKVTELKSGKVSIQSTPPEYVRPLRVAFRVRTSVHHHITLLRAKVGSLYTLLIDEYTYENVMITDLKELEWCNGIFEFEISFAQDTS